MGQRNQRDENLNLIGAGSGGLEKLPYVGSLEANGTNTVTISNVAPSAVGTATISGWLAVNVNGVAYYIPLWT